MLFINLAFSLKLIIGADDASAAPFWENMELISRYQTNLD